MHNISEYKKSYDKKVSVIIPTFNHGHLLERCLNSVLNQSYRNLEIVIVDNNSIDNTKEVIRYFRDKIQINYHLIQNNGIIAKSRNIGIQNSKGDFIAFLDSDDWWLPDKLEISMRYLEKGADLVYHDLWLYGINGIPFFFNKAKTRKLDVPVKRDLLLNGNAINNSSVVLRRSIVEKVGYLSEAREIIAGEDYDYWIRISEVTEKFQKIPICLGYYWIGGGNISSLVRYQRIFDFVYNQYNDFIQKCIGNRKPKWMGYAILLAKLNEREVDLSEILVCYRDIGIFNLAKLLLKWIYNNFTR
ncbi:glycosyltransferase [Leptospira kanakyensis]|uniref:glycosyltransferase n=1 Tax=Leptospira kanakyensis TaxID=2484968 RepID=UPI00142DD2BE|nr:glycosyltransferase [Leptospira kanakyensis]